MYVSGGESKVQCCKEQYCIETWKVRSMNQDRCSQAGDERVNINIFGISEFLAGIGELNSDDHYIYYCAQESLRRNEIALIVKGNPKCSSIQFSRSVVSDSL